MPFRTIAVACLVSAYWVRAKLGSCLYCRGATRRDDVETPGGFGLGHAGQLLDNHLDGKCFDQGDASLDIDDRDPALPAG
jgi:hypothetical protein